jgi:AcrR family transcriptional regulator/DNA-binding MarR family transcriptional regulator
MHTKGRASSKGAAPKELTATRNGFGAVRVEEIQRSRLVAAMAYVAAERGAANVTVAQVVERAGVSRRTFYEIFDDCEDCFLAAFDEGLRRASDCVLVRHSGARWSERTRASLAALLEFLDVEPVIGRLLIVGSLGGGPRGLERRRRVLAQVIAAVDEGRGESRAGKEPPPLTAEGVVGGVLSILHARLLEESPGRLLEFTGPLMSMIVLPYLGSAAARKELERPVPKRQEASPPAASDPLRDVGLRLTYRTVRVLISVAATPGASNREIGEAAGIGDQGQISKLLSRLERLGLVQNAGLGPGTGAPNVWTLTDRGEAIHAAIVSA